MRPLPIMLNANFKRDEEPEKYASVDEHSAQLRTNSSILIV